MIDSRTKANLDETVHMPEIMKGLRCANCKRKLCEYNIDAGIIEVVCPKCNFATSIKKQARIDKKR